MKYLSKLYWKISVVFLVVIVALGGTYAIITANAVWSHFRESNQRLNVDVAAHIAKFTQPFINGSVNEAAMEELFHNVMVLHPSVEVYLLDTYGKILAYSAPDSVIKADQVSLAPLKAFIASEGKDFVEGDDPRHPGAHKVFSAAPIVKNEQLLGYIYVVLLGDKYDSATALITHNYKLKIAAFSVLFTLIGALLIGLTAFLVITQDLNKIIHQVRQFQQGNWNTRIELKSSGELGQLAETFNTMAETISADMEEIQAMEESRRELIANVSHDLRTPLATIQGYAETLMLMKDSLSKENKDHYTGIIVKSGNQLKKLVDELFELSKLEAKRVVPRPEPFSLSELVLDNVVKYKMLAGEKNISLQTNIPQDLPLVYADIGLIDRVLQNLIDNALKFTPKGGTITLGLKRNDNNIEVSVADTGVGISEEDLPKIFDRYARSDKEKTEQSGIGLGLSIIKKILELHQVSIHVYSKVVDGSIFYFNLPLVQVG